MIIIADDTITDRQKFNDVSYLEEQKYQAVCKVYSKIKNNELGKLVNELDKCKLFCNHRTLQLYAPNGKELNTESNETLRNNFINIVAQKEIQRIEFSRGIETNFEFRKLDKELFYTNLKDFLDYYIETGEIETKVLYYGSDFKKVEYYSLVKDIMMQIRILDFKEYIKSDILRKGFKEIFTETDFSKLIEGWEKKQLTKNEIIEIINNQIS